MPDSLTTYVGAAIFTSFIKRKGLERFKRIVLEGLARGKIETSWLKSQFTRNAIEYQGFTYSTWQKLCVNGNGKEAPHEFLFRLRLMWTEWARNGSTPESKSPVSFAEGASGLPAEYENLLKHIMDEYVGRKGFEKFKLFVLDELQNGEKGLGWFRNRFLSSGCISPETLEQFFLDDRSNPIPYTRLFQMHLYLANMYREQTFKQPSEIISR
jgi:hypothetical protein